MSDYENEKTFSSMYLNDVYPVRDKPEPPMDNLELVTFCNQLECMTCPLCKESDFDATGMALHFRECEKALELRDIYRKEAQEQRKKLLKGFKL